MIRRMFSFMVRGALFWMLSGVLTGAGNWVYAQDAQDAPEAQEPEPARPPLATSAPSEEQDTDDDASSDVFIPTEDISEDAAVPFPVDI